MSIEKIILSNLLLNEQYTRKVTPFIKTEYFTTEASKVLYELISDYFFKFKVLPGRKEIEIDLGKKKELNEDCFIEAQSLLHDLETNQIENQEWLDENTESFCQDRSLYLAILKSIEIVDDKNSGLSKSAIPELLKEALSVSFDADIGHDYLEDAADRWDFNHTLQKRVPFDIHYLNKITNGGLIGKSMLMYLAPTGVGKSMIMCHSAASHLKMGYNVLYFTLEMSEESIAERNDANLLNIDIGKINELDKPTFVSLVEKVKDKTKGKLLIKEYPNGQASAANFRHYLQELNLKKSFVPDIIYVDYLNLCASARLKKGGVNSYEYIKSITEELRALAQEFDLPIVTATQGNRDAQGASDLDLTNTSESIGVAFTADLMIGLVQPEDMVALNQMLFIQLKNRYRDTNDPKRFVVGVDKAKMKFYDVEEAAQKDILGGPTVFDNTPSAAMFGDFE